MKIGNIFKKLDGEEIIESILDPPQKDYATWLIKDNKFNPEIRKQIYGLLRDWKKHINFKFEIEDIEAKGSLLTKRFTETSDLDLTVYVSMTDDQINEVYKLLPQGNKIIVDGKETQHPIDFFLVKKDHKPVLDNMDALFSLGKDEWIKKPVEYKNDIPINYLLNVCNFFIDGCSIALTNYNSDKTIYEFYKGLNPDEQDISKDEKDKALADKKGDLKADLDALRMAEHFIAAFRREAYDEETPEIFQITIETKTDNKHVTLNEQLEKIMEKLGIRQEMKAKIEECEKLLEDEKPQEEKSSED